jgi:hypothetical protein
MNSAKIQTNETNNPPEVLYHYTNQRGLLGIISDFEIWATKILYLNDTSEFHLVFDIAKQDLEERSWASIIGNRKANALRRALDSWEWVNILVCSFSEDRDSLSQWRAYGDENSGYSIGFYSEPLQQIASQNKFVLAKCIYDGETQRKMVIDLINLTMHQEFPFKANEFYDIGDPDINKITEKFIESLVRLAPILKNQHFSSEKEWRLISEPISYSDPRFAFRKGISMITPYYKFPLRIENELPKIKELVVGPTPHLKLESNSVEMLLKKKGLNSTKVLNSEIPLRNY